MVVSCLSQALGYSTQDLSLHMRPRPYGMHRSAHQWHHCPVQVALKLLYCPSVDLSARRRFFGTLLLWHGSRPATPPDSSAPLDPAVPSGPSGIPFSSAEGASNLFVCLRRQQQQQGAIGVGDSPINMDCPFPAVPAEGDEKDIAAADRWGSHHL